VAQLQRDLQGCFKISDGNLKIYLIDEIVRCNFLARQTIQIQAFLTFTLFLFSFIMPHLPLQKAVISGTVAAGVVFIQCASFVIERVNNNL
jgi:hypothetical protein